MFVSKLSKNCVRLFWHSRFNIQNSCGKSYKLPNIYFYSERTFSGQLSFFPLNSLTPKYLENMIGAESNYFVRYFERF